MCAASSRAPETTSEPPATSSRRPPPRLRRPFEVSGPLSRTPRRRRHGRPPAPEISFPEPPSTRTRPAVSQTTRTPSFYPLTRPPRFRRPPLAFSDAHIACHVTRGRHASPSRFDHLGSSYPLLPRSRPLHLVSTPTRSLRPPLCAFSTPTPPATSHATQRASPYRFEHPGSHYALSTPSRIPPAPSDVV